MNQARTSEGAMAQTAHPETMTFEKDERPQ